jgi:hypothetical protein
MDAALEKLMKRMPPLKKSPNTKVNWSLLEEHVGLVYPDSYKEFIAVYGSSYWLGSFVPFYACPTSQREAREFMKSVRAKLKYLEGNTYHEDHGKFDVPLYPAPGGLFPFMVGPDGPLYCWRTEAKDPNRWPVYCWVTGPIIVLNKITIAGMVLEFLTRKRRMLRAWGDVREVPQELIRLTDCWD